MNPGRQEGRDQEGGAASENRDDLLDELDEEITEGDDSLDSDDDDLDDDLDEDGADDSEDDEDSADGERDASDDRNDRSDRGTRDRNRGRDRGRDRDSERVSPNFSSEGMRTLIEFVARELVEKKEEVNLREVKSSRSVIFELTCDPTDMGRIIGKEGRIIKALRTVVKAVAARQGGETVELEVVE